MSQRHHNEIQALLARADESIEAAKELFKSGHCDFSASRSYYAVFYASSALLLNSDLEFHKHSGVLAAVH